MSNSFNNQINTLKSRARKNASNQARSRGVLVFNGNNQKINGDFIFSTNYPNVVQFFTLNKKYAYVVFLENMSAMRMPRNNSKNVNINTIKDGFKVNKNRSGMNVNSHVININNR